MNSVHKRFFGVLFSLVITAFLLSGLLVIVGLTQKNQDVKRSKASGETVQLSLSPSTTAVTSASPDFTVSVMAMVPANNPAKVTAATIGLSYDPALLSLQSITPASLSPFFAYTQTTTEALNLGFSCTSSTIPADCRTLATGVTCTNNYCSNTGGYQGSTAGTAKFDVGAACDVTHMGCLNNTCSVLKGAGTDSCTTTCTGTETNAVPAKCYPTVGSTTDVTGVLAIVKFRALANGTATIDFNKTVTQASGLDATNTAINTSIASYPTTTSKTVTISGFGTANQVVLPFKVKFEAITGANHTTHQKVRMIVRSGTTQVALVDNIDVTPDANAVFSGQATFSGVAAGTYDILIKGPTTLQKKFTNVTLVAGTNPTKDFSLISDLKAGDLAGVSLADPPDNKVDGTDVAKLLQKFDILATVPAGTAQDLNDDLKVDGFDMKYLLNNFNILFGGDQ